MYRCDPTTPCAIAEERDANNVVTRRFYSQGEQINGSPFYYMRDQLGSVRELTDSVGNVRARYDYDPYGYRTKLSGDLDAQFGFTGFYYHARSGLNLALYRAYDFLTGRWLSRDPIGEEGELNLYGYVANNALNAVDTLGLDANDVGDGWFTFSMRRDFNLAGIVGATVRHPKSSLSGQCGVTAQYLTGRSTASGGVIDAAPNARDNWRQGEPVTQSTLPFTMIAMGWQGGRYPGLSPTEYRRRYSDAPNVNHTGILIHAGRSSCRVLEASAGQPLRIVDYPNKGFDWSVIRSQVPYSSGVSASSLVPGQP
jgi:RHS repeat-associated protein